MATIITDTYLDDGTARTAGEAWTINNGAKLTVRTDSRWYNGSPASFTGSLSSITCNEGEVLFDGRDVRWLAITSGSGTSAIGTTVTQGAVTGYFLGYWATLTSQPSTTIGASGFLKFREVTGGTFSTGALTFGAGTGAATASGADVTGWIEIVADAAANHTFPRLGKHTIRGNWFYLANTTGSVAQTIQMPTMGGGAATYCPGIWIEDSAPRASTYTWANNIVTVTLTSHDYVVGQKIEIDFTSGTGTPDGEYEVLAVNSTSEFTFSLTGSGTAGNCTITSYSYFPSLYTSTNGWAKQNIGGPYTATDKRQNFVKDIGSGQIQIGEVSDLAGTYANIAAQASTYAIIAQVSQYVVVDNICTVTYATGHLLQTGQQVGIDFLSGGATALDAIFTVTVLDPYTYTFTLTTANTSGGCTTRPGLTVTFAAHGLGVGDVVYCDFTSGGGVDGDYTIYAVNATGTYLLSYPTAVTIASGNVSVHSRYTITFTAHGLAVGNRVYLDFTTGAGVDGIYTIVAVAANTFEVVMNNNGAADSGNVTIKQIIGNVPASGLRTRIPNVILRECATGTRATNSAPNATIATRPEWAVTTAGAIDFEYAYTQWYMNFAQAYLVRLHNSTTYDTLIISEAATALDLNNMHVSMYGAQDLRTFSCLSNFAGGTVKNCSFHRGNTPGTTDHSVEINYCNNIIFSNCTAGIIQYVRSTGKAFTLSYCNGLVFNDCRQFQSDLSMTACLNISVNRLDHVDRYIGYTNITTPYYAIALASGCSNVICDRLTFGFNGSIINNHPSSGLFYFIADINCKFKNMGTRSSPLLCGSWRPNLYAMATTHVTGGNNNGITMQRIYIDHYARTGGFTTINSDKNMIYESVHPGRYVESARAIYNQSDAGLNSNMKGCMCGNISNAGQSSVYGTHFKDLFLGDTFGKLALAANEPTTETTSQFNMISGTARFDSAGGIVLRVVGDTAEFIDDTYRKGITGFKISAPTITSITTLTVTAGSWATNVTTLTTGTHGLNVGDTVIVTGITPAAYNGVFTITVIPSTTTFSYSQLSNPGTWSSGGNITQLDTVSLYYALDQGTGSFGSYANLKLTKTGGVTTNTTNTITMTSNTGVAVGDYVTSKIVGIGSLAKVTDVSVDGVTVTVDVASSVTTATNVFYFNHLPSETVTNSDIGFKIKIKAIVDYGCTTTKFSFIMIDTISTLAAQISGLYPITIPVTSTVIVKDLITLANIQDARVLLLADASGPMPSNETVTIVNSGTTATVTHSAHGMENGDKVQIKGASLTANNGIFTIAYINGNSYSYTMSSTPGSSPTGTILATYVVISGLTDSNGTIMASKYFSSNQPVIGRVRKATSGTLYKTGSVVGTIDASTGFNTTVQMIVDA